VRVRGSVYILKIAACIWLGRVAVLLSGVFSGSISGVG
jgi:hypothetical protein